MSTCTNINENGKECQRPVFESSPVSLCQLHLLTAAQFVKEMGGLGAAHVLMVAPAAVSATKGVARIKHGKPQCVYYVRNGARIKIGTTTDLPTRMLNVPGDELMAIEPGTNATERRRHEQFADLRVRGEWFDARLRLLDFVVELRMELGDPLELWAKMTDAETS